nr:MerR family transcriptional regulator [Bacillus velezensis]WGE00380.1 MerR family transcriptional regulator [Bacillus velezensis]
MYTIGQVSKISGFSIDTLRYYEKIGLLPPPQRKESGVRIYFQKDIDTLSFLRCLKKTGLSVEEMTEFIHARGFALAHKTPMTEEYATSVKTKVEILTKHVSKLEKQLTDIENVISLTKKKIGTYHDILSQMKE